MERAANALDFYKAGHIFQYPEGTEYVYSNMTARNGKYSNTPFNGVVFVGLQYFIQEFLIEAWDETFFNLTEHEAIKHYKRRIEKGLGSDQDVDHMRQLHQLGYLPIKIKALPEGSFVPYGVPMFTITNTHEDFYWLPNRLESVMSSELWQMICSATTYLAYRKVFQQYAELTCDSDEHVPYQGHDFSYRGLPGRHAAAASAFAVIAAGSNGTDSVPALDIAEDYYYMCHDDLDAIGSIPATEHSVMCAGGEDSEYETFLRLITEVYPDGHISIVSDTWDLWSVVSDILPRLKNTIIQRDGTVVIRPDSGNPADIICGTKGLGKDEDDTRTVEEKGLIESLWEIFGGRINSKGYKVLHPNIRAIYGESITLERQKDILSRLKQKGFASENIYLGIGSYTFQNVTRDTHSIAIKSTSVVINGERRDIFKNPKTAGGDKKSAKGLLMVCKEGSTYTVVDSVDETQEERGCLETVFEDGYNVKEYTFAEIRENVNNAFKNL